MMDPSDIFQKQTREENVPIPPPNAMVRISDDEGEWTEEQIKGIICNPIYAGIGPFPSFVSDEVWIRCASKQISNEGAEQFLVNLLTVLRECFPEE